MADCSRILGPGASGFLGRYLTPALQFVYPAAACTGTQYPESSIPSAPGIVGIVETNAVATPPPSPRPDLAMRPGWVTQPPGTSVRAMACKHVRGLASRYRNRPRRPNCLCRKVERPTCRRLLGRIGTTNTPSLPRIVNETPRCPTERISVSVRPLA